MVDLEHVLVVAALLFSVGLYIALSRRSAIGVLTQAASARSPHSLPSQKNAKGAMTR